MAVKTSVGACRSGLPSRAFRALQGRQLLTLRKEVVSVADGEGGAKHRDRHPPDVTDDGLRLHPLDDDLRSAA